MFNSFTYVAPMNVPRLAKKKSFIDGAKVPSKKKQKVNSALKKTAIQLNNGSELTFAAGCRD